MSAILQIFCSAISIMKITAFLNTFILIWFLKVQLTISRHWFMWWLGIKEAMSHYLNQWWPSSLGDAYVSPGLNELNNCCCLFFFNLQFDPMCIHPKSNRFLWICMMQLAESVLCILMPWCFCTRESVDTMLNNTYLRLQAFPVVISPWTNMTTDGNFRSIFFNENTSIFIAVFNKNISILTVFPWNIILQGLIDANVLCACTIHSRMWCKSPTPGHIWPLYFALGHCTI